jgi:hypothetical protein
MIHIRVCKFVQKSNVKNNPDISRQPEENRMSAKDDFAKKFMTRSSTSGVAANAETISKWLCPKCKKVYGQKAGETEAVWAVPKEEGLGVIVGPIVTCYSCDTRSCFNDDGAFMDEVEENQQ